MSEEYNDNLRRRRRNRNPEEAEQPVQAEAPETGGSRVTVIPDTTETAGQPGTVAPAGRAAEPKRAETVQAMGQGSRVPAEARRMSASPYGAGSAAAARRPGTRQVQDARRPAVREGNPQQSRNTSRGANASRIGVGYAPGRMTIQNQRPDTAGDPNRSRAYAEHRYPTHTRKPQANNAMTMGNGRRDGLDGGDGGGRKKKWLIILGVLAALAVAVVVAFKVLPDDFLNRITGRKQEETSDPVNGQEEAENPALSGDVSADDRENGMASDAVPEDAQAEDTASDTVSDTASDAASDMETIALNMPETPEENQGDPDMPAENMPDGEPMDPDAPDEGIPEEDVPEEGVPEEDTADPDMPDEEFPEEDAGDPDMPDEEIPEDEPGDPETQYAEATALADTETVPSDEPEAGEQADADAPAGEDGETVSGQAAETADAEPEPAPVLTAEAAPGANPDILTTKVYDGKNVKKEYSRPAKEQIHMQPGWEYTKHNLGVITFRGNAFRTNGAVGTVTSAEGLEKIWELQTGSLKGANQTYYGSGWPGQPAIVWWPKEIRLQSNIDEEKKSIKNLKEVIVPVQDGTIRFLNLQDGSITRNSIKLGYPMKGTPSLHPGGFPYMTVGQSARKLKNKTGKIGLRQYNMYNLTELTPLIDGLDGKLHRAPNNTGNFETSALIDRKSDTLITAGTNGMLYLIRLNSELDFNLGLLTYKPDTIVAICTKKKEKAAQTAVESSLAMYDKYVFYADMGGILRCVDTDFLVPVWAVETGDSVMAAVALDQRDPESLDLYTANMLNLRKKGSAQIRRYNALNGTEAWCTEIGVQKDTKNKTDSGCKASPVIGENNLSDLVFYTVTGLNDEGRTTLNVPDETKAALVALDKETGKIRWAYALSDRSDSSPIAVYDEAGNGRIIQCAWDGSVVMVDGLSGQRVATLQLEGNIEASPAAFDDIMVVGTTGKGTEDIYGVRIK